jgi:hypothetical protein
MNFREIGWLVINYNDLAQDRDQWMALANIVMKLWVPWNIWKYLSD